MSPSTRQLVGIDCALCARAIRNIVEGAFCPACGCPIHTECARPGAGVGGDCGRCGATPEVIAIHRQAEVHNTHDRAVTIQSHHALQNTLSGLAMLVGGLAYSFLKTISGRGPWRIVIAMGAIVGGVALLYQGLVQWAQLPKRRDRP